MKNKKNQYRQGDVLVERVGPLPTDLTKIARENGRVILAHGEVTGHAHAIEDPGTDLLAAKNGERFLRVEGTPIKARLKIIRRWRNQVLVQHPKHGLVQFAETDVAINTGGTVEIDDSFALLKHDEHHAHALPAGNYRNIRQSEYSPEEIRRVAD